MQVSVQKFTSTTRPRKSAGPSGSELSHPAAPSNRGMSSRSGTSSLPQRAERGAELFGEELGLLPCREVPTPINRVVVDEVRVCPLRPAARSLVELLRKDRHRRRHGNALGVE